MTSLSTRFLGQPRLTNPIFGVLSDIQMILARKPGRGANPAVTVAALYGAVNELRWRGVIPLLASPQGGVAASSRKYGEATEADAAGVVFLFVLIRKTTPASLSTDASRHFIDRSATPPCGDARRGIPSIPVRSHF